MAWMVKVRLEMCVSVRTHLRHSMKGPGSTVCGQRMRCGGDHDIERVRAFVCHWSWNAHALTHRHTRTYTQSLSPLSLFLSQRTHRHVEPGEGAVEALHVQVRAEEPQLAVVNVLVGLHALEALRGVGVCV